MKLKPCPFCGEGNIRIERDGHGVFTICDNCRATGPYIDMSADKPATLIDNAGALAWNKRTPPRGLPRMPSK